MAQANLCDGGAASVWAACRGQRQPRVGQGGGGRYSIWRDCQASVRFNLAGNGRVETCTKDSLSLWGKIFLLLFTFPKINLPLERLRRFAPNWSSSSPLPLAYATAIEVFGFALFYRYTEMDSLKPNALRYLGYSYLTLPHFVCVCVCACNPHLLPTALGTLIRAQLGRPFG